jgi:hypothetical protein
VTAQDDAAARAAADLLNGARNPDASRPLGYFRHLVHGGRRLRRARR